MRIPTLLFALLLVPGVNASLPAQSLGRITFPTSAAGAAGEDFVQGMSYLHSFEYASAAEAFRRAQSRDPRFAMAYWGEALTYTHQIWNQQDLATARAVLARLGPNPTARISAAPTAREKAYGAAIETLYGEGSKEQRDTLYSRAMERIALEYPDDDEAKILYATALFGLTQGARDVPLYMRAGAIAQDVLMRNPDHPGAAHMVIHAFDDPVHAPLGLHAAREYSRIAPAAAHAQHMTTHIFLALGMWNDVVSQNIVAAGPDSAQWKAGHYTHWLLYAYLQQGRMAASRALLKSLTDHGSMRGPMANFRSRYVMESGEWDGPEARALIADAGAAGEDGYEYATFVAGHAASRRGDTVTARQVLERMERSVAGGTIQPGARGSDAVPVILALSLGAELARQAGHLDSARVLLMRATELEETMPAEFGPPAVVKPTYELLGALHLEMGRSADAASAFAKALQLQPGRSAAYLGLATAERSRGRIHEAEDAENRLRANWVQADPTVRALLKP